MVPALETCLALRVNCRLPIGPCACTHMRVCECVCVRIRETRMGGLGDSRNWVTELGGRGRAPNCIGSPGLAEGPGANVCLEDSGGGGEVG